MNPQHKLMEFTGLKKKWFNTLKADQSNTFLVHVYNLSERLVKLVHVHRTQACVCINRKIPFVSFCTLSCPSIINIQNFPMTSAPNIDVFLFAMRRQITINQIDFGFSFYITYTTNNLMLYVSLALFA